MKVDLAPDGAAWQLDHSFEQFAAALPLHVVSELLAAVEAENLSLSEAATFALPAQAIAAWPEAAALGLGLPRNTPLALDVRLNGGLGKPGCRLGSRWLQPGKTVSARDVSVQGCWLQWAGQRYRLPAPMFEALALVDAFNAIPERDDALDEQFRVWARIRQALGDEGTERLTDHFLRGFRVVTASALSFSITTDVQGEVQLEPVLLQDGRSLGAEAPVHERALTEANEAVFVKRLDELREGSRAFPLSGGTYVVVEEPLRHALAAVRRLRRSSPTLRKRAALSPEAVLREMLEQPEDAPTVFVETERYAERVRDIGEWVPPAVPWIKIPPQDWAPPVALGVRLQGRDIPIEPGKLQQLCAQMEAALEDGRPMVTLGGGEELPATPANLAALQQLRQAVEAREQGRQPAPDDATAAEEQRQVLVIETNFDDAAFNQVKVASRLGLAGWPADVATSPKAHQEQGLHWLQQHWLAGSKGALLCDDMGLGKTFQALVFCQWLREQMRAGRLPRQPILVVAPVGLLKNWEQEHDNHLVAPGVGQLLPAYGEHLRGLKRGRHVDGTAELDTARLAGADLVLANYEAVTEYQMSFGAVRFAAVVLDEAQRIKSPGTRVTHAVKALNADFMLAMTGTPVENRLADLWCIADAVQPGALQDLRSFSARYETQGAEVRTLRDLVWQSEEATDAPPRLLLRRLKSDKLKGLPTKHEHAVRMPMPPRQREAYERAVAIGDMKGAGGTLEMIQAMRRVSLHPVLAEGGVAAEEELDFADSARMMAAIAVLDGVCGAGEKALVFLESLDLQDSRQLPSLLQRRYRLKRPPMVINGQVSTAERQERVKAFQSERGFDVMLLSPKAGGVGLTLTAANHVVHLSRWWNPAVEDQCSDRVYRIGQEREVHIHYPLAVLPGNEEASFDVQLQKLMDRKRDLARNLLAAPAFTREDYAELLAGTRS